MKTKSCTVFLILSFILAAHAAGQDLKIENVSFEDQGEIVVIRYDLIGIAKKKYCVSISLSYDYGKTFVVIPENVTGEVKKNIRSGRGKEIQWDFRKDFPDGLIGDGFVFAVEAEVQKWNKSVLFALGAGVLGGVFLFAFKDRIVEPDPITGNVEIIVPSDL